MMKTRKLVLIDMFRRICNTLQPSNQNNECNDIYLTIGNESFNFCHKYQPCSFSSWNIIKVILCASEHIFSIVRYCFRSFKHLLKDPLHVLTDANVLVLIDTYPSIFVNGRFSLPSNIHLPIIYA